MNSMTAEITGVLLAGGKSRRMGRDKRFLDFGGRTLVERGLIVFEQLFSEILLVVAEPTPQLSKFGHRVITDVVPDCGSLGGLYTGLSYASHPRVFAAACDMPFLDPAVITLLAAFDREADVVIPQLATGLQPMHAIYSKDCLPRLKLMMSAGNLRLHELAGIAELSVQVVPEEQIRSIDPRFLSFINVNRPADLELARKLNAGRRTRVEEDA
ncbi:MAG: molybdenum cofactor guanylyltransferase [Nitrospiraceae bacterium]